MAVSSLLCGFTAWIALYGCQLILGTEGIIRQLVTLSVSASAGLLVFAGLVIQLKLPEMDFFVDRLRQKLPFLARKS